MNNNQPPPEKQELCGCEADEWGIEHTKDAHVQPHQDEGMEITQEMVESFKKAPDSFEFGMTAKQLRQILAKDRQQLKLRIEELVIRDNPDHEQRVYNEGIIDCLAILEGEERV